MSSLLRAEDSVLLLVDIQERFRGAVAGMDGVVARSVILVKAALRLGIPVLASEQYPKALGSTVAELRSILPGSEDPEAGPYFPKMCFSAAGCDPLRARLAALSGTGAGSGAAKRRQVVLAGVEAHVCVLQTALELQAGGLSVHVVEDAVASRKGDDREAALRRMERHGVERVTSEMAVFEWLRRAGTPEFKELQALIK